MERFNFYADNHKKGDLFFTEHEEWESLDEVKRRAQELAEIWGCNYVNVKVSGQQDFLYLD